MHARPPDRFLCSCVALALIGGLTGCATPVTAATPISVSSSTPTPSPTAGRCIQIVGTNDLHGHALARPVHIGALTAQRGGLAALGGYLAILRAKYPGQVLLLDAGDLFQGTLISNLNNGEAVIAGMNELGYAASTIGNHEFDFGPLPGSTDLQSVLKARIAQAHFPFVAANFEDKATGALPEWKNLSTSVVREVNGLRVGVVGAMTRDTPFTTMPPFVRNVSITASAPAIEREATRLRSEGAQLVVLTAHIGGECLTPSAPEDLTSCVQDSELFELMRALPKGTVDAVVGGHTHRLLANIVNGVPVAEAGASGEFFDWLTACVDATGAHVTVHPPTQLCLQEWNTGGCLPGAHPTAVKSATFLGEPVKPDAAVTAALAPFAAEAAKFGGRSIGATLARGLKKNRTGPSALGTLVAEALRKAVPHAEIGIYNAGGLRAELPAGALDYQALFELLPFEDRVIGLKLTGKQVFDRVVAPLEHGFSFPQLSGVQLVQTESGPALVDLDRQPLRNDRQYLVATIDFLGLGGDGTPTDQPLAWGPGPLVRDALLHHLQSMPQPIDPPEPQIDPNLKLPKPASKHP